jgi:hypothetical protein
VAAIEHQITHYFQPTNHSCGQAATAILMSHFGRHDTPDSVLQSVPTLQVGEDDEWGTLAPSLATWVIQQGFAVTMHTFDFQLLDLSWSGLDMSALRDRIEAAAGVRVVPSLGDDVSRIFLHTYRDFLDAGGRLRIHSHLTTSLLDELLVDAPVFANLNTNVLYNRGRQREAGLREITGDDLHGGVDTHFVVIYGTDDNGAYFVADPWEAPGRHVIEKERLFAAIGAGQIQCENAIFQALRP